MTRAHVLCVDDSEAILSFERATLAPDYTVSTAMNGEEALAKIAELHPDCVLLDLSMPLLDGDEVLARMKANPRLREIPVIVVTSEEARARACVSQGAASFVPKPIRADALVGAIARALAARRAAARSRALGVLRARVGDLEIGFVLEHVRRVVLEPRTVPLASGPPFLDEMVQLGPEPIAVLDLASVLGATYRLPAVDRKLIVLARDGVALAVRVDDVRDPEEFSPEATTPRERLGGGDHAPLGRALVAVVRTAEGPVAVIDPTALLAPDLLEGLPALLRAVGHASS